MVAAKRTLWYLKGTRERQFVMNPGDGDELVVFADSNRGPKNDKKRRSRARTVIKIGTEPIFRISKTQKLASLISFEAEYNELVEAATRTVGFEEC